MKNETHVRDAEGCVERIKEWHIKEEEKSKVKEYLKEYASGRITQKIGTNQNALIERLTQLLRVSLENLKQPTKKEVETFFENLVLKNKVKSYNPKTKKYTGKPYAQKTQVEIISALKKYLLWRYKNAEIISPLNIKIGKKERDIESLTIPEIEKLYKGCKSDEERYILAGLFSTGARAEEFMSLRICDITLPQKDEFIKVVIRNDTSKTKGRTISLYWTPTLECFSEYLKKRKEEGAKPTDFVLTRNYVSVQRWVSRLGQNVLDKRVHPHIFRHACADWLASRLNRQQMCVFFGWSFSSPMPDVYINRQNINMKEVDDKVMSSNYQELKEKMEKQEYENKLKNEELDNIRKESSEIREILDAKLRELDKMDIFFKRAIEDPKFMGKLNKIMEKKFLKGELDNSHEMKHPFLSERLQLKAEKLVKEVNDRNK